MFQFLVYSIFIILMVFVKKNCLTFLNQQIKELLCKKKIIFAMESIMEKLAYILFFENSITTAINFAKDQLLIKLLTYYT